VPDVITLDVEIPRMDGITFLRKLMRNTRCRRDVLVADRRWLETLMQALGSRRGRHHSQAADEVSQFLHEASIRICDAVKGAAKAR